MEPLQFPLPVAATTPEVAPLVVGERVRMCGYSHPNGWIVSVISQAKPNGSDGQTTFVFGESGLVRAPAMAHVMIVWEDGREVRDDHFDPRYTYDRRPDNRIETYRIGEVDPEWQTNVSAARAAYAEVQAKAKAESDARAAAGRAECARLSLLFPSALIIRDGSGRYAVDESGAVYVWQHEGSTWRKYSVGDVIRHGSYNFDYTGTMTKATAKTVFFTEYGKPSKMLADKFYSYNIDFDLARSEKARQEWND